DHTKDSVREPLATYVAGPGRGGARRRGVPVSASSPPLCPADSPSHLPGQTLARALDDPLGQASAATALCQGILRHARRARPQSLSNHPTVLIGESASCVTGWFSRTTPSLPGPLAPPTLAACGGARAQPISAARIFRSHLPRGESERLAAGDGKVEANRHS